MTRNMAISTKIRRVRSYRGFEKWLKDYCENTSVIGCMFYVASGAGPKQRIFWVVGHVICIMSVLVMITKATQEFAEIPTVTTPETSKYPIQEVDFPAVAICALNKINYTAAMEVAEDILESSHGGNFTLHEVTDMLKYLGHLYLFELNEREEDVVALLHKLLIRRYEEYVPDVLKSLAPSCRWILEYCSWSGREEACEDIFFPRKTGDGYCCTFNYARTSDDFSGKNVDAQTLAYVEIEHSKIIGSRFGLTVLMRSDIRNHHYKILPALGYKILIYPSMDYPDAPSGGVRQFLVSPRTETSLTLEATPFYSVPEVLKYSVDKRGCLFKDELSFIFGKFYTYSNCIMHCRITDIQELCDCVPFFYPIPTNRGHVRTCDLRDLPCLKKGSARWMRISPRPGNFRVPSRDFTPDTPNGDLNCSVCFPACRDVVYEASGNSAPLSSSTVRMGRFVYNLTEGHSIVNIFFKIAATQRLKQDVLFYWYDLLSNYGGLCSLFLGVSFISVVEFLYFITLRFYNRKDGMKREGNYRVTFVRVARPSLRPLYWNEMMQPNAKY